MKKNIKEYIILLVVFLLFLFRNSIDNIVIIFNNNLNYKNVCEYVNNNVLKENRELREIIKLGENLSYNHIISLIKYRDILDFTNTVEIYKGSLDGIKIGSAVINDLGLVGVVDKTDKHSSTVNLLTHKNSNISVKVNNSYGLLKYKEGKLIVSNLTNYDEVNLGDLIYTSGIGNLPGEIYVGKVKQIELDSLGIEKIITVESAVDFEDISYLLVLGES